MITITFDVPDDPVLLDIVVKSAQELSLKYARKFKLVEVYVTETHELYDLAVTIHKYSLEAG